MCDIALESEIGNLLMRVLVIDEAAQARAKALRQYAIEHKEKLIDLVNRMNKGDQQAPGNNPNFVLELFDGWRVVMTIEQSPPPPYGAGCWCYHISISVVPQRAEKMMPDPFAIETQILPLLGIKAKLKDALNMSHTGNIVELWFPAPTAQTV